MAASPACRSVGDHLVHRAREIMFGTREAFTYLQCAACGTLWLLDPPATWPDMRPASIGRDSPAAGVRAPLRRLTAMDQTVTHGPRSGLLRSRP